MIRWGATFFLRLFIESDIRTALFLKLSSQKVEEDSGSKKKEDGLTETIQSESEPQTSNAAKRLETVTDSESNSKETFLNNRTNRQRGL